MQNFSFESREFVRLNSGTLPLRIVRSRRARRYLLRLNEDSSAQVTIPRGGSLAEARGFVERNLAWLERAAQRLTSRPVLPREWVIGTEILWRGEPHRIEATPDSSPAVRFATELVRVRDLDFDLRSAIEKHIWTVAASELPAVVQSFAHLHGLSVQRVTVRDQRSRWGSCSRRGTISLNWRILQAPPYVRDYLILHELMHLREMNHSARFWAHVASVCPEYKRAELWLRKHSHLLRHR